MRKAIKQIAACALGLLVVCLICRFGFFRSYTAYIPLYSDQADTLRREGVRMEMDREGVLQAEEPEVRDGYIRVRMHPGSQGETGITIRTSERDSEDVKFEVMGVTPLHTVYDRGTGDFTGDIIVLIALAVFWLLVCAIMVWHFSRSKGAAFYSYGTIYYAGFSLFALTTGLTMVQVSIRRIADPAEYHMLSAYSAINSASTRFMMMTMPLVLLFALAMAVSNVALLRHERPRPQNVLGLLVSLMLIGGEVIGWLLVSRDFSGSEWEGRIENTLQNTYATVFVYFECMLAGSVICGLLAARHEPPFEQDYIIILGCWFRPDGTLPPLLRGRVDRALDYWRCQKKETGREAVFVPTGGRGRDEPLPEAEAIGNYLREQGIPDRLILSESRALNTFQNMSYSRDLIRQENPEARVTFATTNYHVFRSGILAAQTGMPAEGIGSRTRWWFWPNAFMRETAGLLKKRWKQELLFLLLLIGFFALLSLTVG